MPREVSWHIPTIPSYNGPIPGQVLNVFFLQRMTELEQKQVEQAVKTIDHEAVQRLNVAESPAPRRLQIKKWIRDYFPTSASTLEIARVAYYKQHFSDRSYSSMVFVDSGWDLGNVIVAHWEERGESEDARLSAARVSMGIANVLLTACDQIEGMTLSHALGHDTFEQSKVDFYLDLPVDDQPSALRKPSELKWPSQLPEDMRLDKAHPTIISLRTLDDQTISDLKREINSGAEAGHRDIQIYNWEGPEPTNRLILRDIYNKMHCNTSEQNQDSYAFFIDYMLQGSNGELQILAVSTIKRSPGMGVEVLPIFTAKFFDACETTSEKQALAGRPDIVDIWKKEHVDHINTANSEMDACPIFFLQPFTQEEERQLRTSVCALGDVESGEDWGHDFIWHGYLFDDGQKHTMQDLRDFFESCDPFSPSFDKKKAGPHRLASYPHNFAALDDKVLDTKEPKVWMASTLDLSGEDTSESLGWTIGRLDAAQTHIVYVNLDIANMGPEECFDEDTVDQLWLSDLKAYREEDWARENDEEQEEEEEEEEEE